MKEIMSYCGKDNNGRYIDFSKSKQCVKMKGHEKIFRVNIRVCTNGKFNTHWSWWDNEKSEFLFTQQNKLEVIMSLPYSVDFAEKQGKGKLVPVRIEEN